MSVRTGITSLVVTMVLLTSAVSVLATPVLSQLSQVTDQPFYDVSSYTYYPQPAIAGQSTTLSVSIVNVTQDSQIRPAAGETVTFSLENPVGIIGHAVTDSNGIASINYTFSSPGTHTLYFSTRSGNSFKNETVKNGTITVTGNTNTSSAAVAGSASATAAGNATTMLVDGYNPRLPGFEALYAVAGLLAVAYLVMRRRK
jgi:PGF-CTERM protein